MRNKEKWSSAIDGRATDRQEMVQFGDKIVKAGDSREEERSVEVVTRIEREVCSTFSATGKKSGGSFYRHLSGLQRDVCPQR